MTQETADGIVWEITAGDHDGLGPGHEHELTPLVLDLLPEGGAFLDVGAHVGHYSLRAAKKASVVWAVEPNPDSAARLRHNADINGMTNVFVIQIAAWNGVQRMTIQRVHKEYVRDGSGRTIPDDDGAVWAARLDDALNQFPLRPERLDLIKLDVEGADLEALDGMRGLIAKHQPVLFIEDHSYLGYYKQENLLALIAELGYATQLVESDGSAWWICRPVSQ